MVSHEIGHFRIEYSTGESKFEISIAKESLKKNSWPIE